MEEKHEQKITGYHICLSFFTVFSCFHNTPTTGIPSSPSKEVAIIGDCLFTENTSPVLSAKSHTGDEKMAGFTAAAISSIVVPVVTTIALDSISKYIKSRETNKSSTSSASTYRQNISRPDTKNQCLIFARGNFGNIIDTKSIEKSNPNWTVDKINSLRDQGVNLTTIPEVYLELMLDGFHHTLDPELIVEKDKTEKKCSLDKDIYETAAKENGDNIPYVEMLKDKKNKSCSEYELAKSNWKKGSSINICPRPTYIDYLIGGAKTNQNGDKKISFTASFFTPEKDKKVQFYSHAFDLGNMAAGDDPMTVNDEALYMFDRVKINNTFIASQQIPCFTIQNGISDVFVNTIFLEEERKSDFNLAIADALASESTKKAVVGIIQEEIKADSIKELEEAKAVLDEKKLRKELVCNKEESLEKCAERIRNDF